MRRPITKVVPAPRFHRSFQALPPAVQTKASVRDKIFRQNAFDPCLKTHALKGKLRGLWSYSVDRSIRVLFEFIASGEALYHDIGSHDIYR